MYLQEFKYALGIPIPLGIPCIYIYIYIYIYKCTNDFSIFASQNLWVYYIGDGTG